MKSHSETPTMIGISIVLAVPAWYYQGIAWSWVWEWFVVPLGAPSISPLHAMGIGILFLPLLASVAKRKELDGALAIVVASIVQSTMMLAMGWALNWLGAT